jgi:hydroxyethylthiazole kinase
MTAPVYELLERVRREKPVVHHITNWVTIYDCAQVVKSIGGSPVMAHAPEEVADMVQIASALVLNIGTLSESLVASMKVASKAARKRGLPVLLDVCGAGATVFRDQKSFELLDSGTINIIKGNASEIARVSGASIRTKGVDSADVEGDLVSLAEKLAIKRDATVVVTGQSDIVTNGRSTWRIENGHPMMTHVVGTGCMAASVIGAFAALESTLPVAAASALACYGVAAEIAAENSHGPATFKELLFDSLYALDADTLTRRQRIFLQALREERLKQ